MIPVPGGLVLDHLSWAFPARWGFAATAATADLRSIAPLLQSNEALWTHDPGWWLLNMTMLIVVGVGLAAWTRWRPRLGALCPIGQCSARHRRPMPLRRVV